MMGSRILAGGSAGGLAARWGVTLLAACALLTLSELALRAFWLPHFTQLYRLDDELLYATVGGASHYFEHDARNGSGRVLVSLDADGFRAAEPAQSDAGEHDTPLLLVTLPSRADLCRAANTCLEALSGERGYDPRNLTRAFERAADAAGARHLSLFERFQAADACELSFAPPDSHWNASGQRLAAESVAEEIARLGLLPADRP